MDEDEIMLEDAVAMKDENKATGLGDVQVSQDEYFNESEKTYKSSKRSSKSHTRGAVDDHHKKRKKSKKEYDDAGMRVSRKESRVS